MLRQGPLRVALVGDAEVGKSSIVLRWSRNRISEGYETTLEDAVEGDVIIARRSYPVVIIDTPGHEDFATIRDSYLRKCDALMFVYDVTQPDSLTRIRDYYWPTALEIRDEDTVPCVLVGNKTDCDRVVTPREGNEVAEEMDTVLVEMSTHSTDGQTKAIQAVAEAAARGHRARTPRVTIDEGNKGCGCVLS